MYPVLGAGELVSRALERSVDVSAGLVWRLCPGVPICIIIQILNFCSSRVYCTLLVFTSRSLGLSVSGELVY